MVSSPATRSRAEKKRISDARLKTTPPARLRKLAAYPETHRRLARNPRTPAEVLGELAKSDDVKVLRGLAANRSTPAEVLSELAKSDDLRVLRGLAANRSTPARSITAIAKRTADETALLDLAARADLPDGAAKALASSDHHRVKKRLVARPSLPLDAQLVLATEHQNSIRWDLVENENTKAEVLDLMSRDPDQGFAAVAAQQPNVAARTLARLADHPDPVVRARVAAADATSTYTLRKLLKDPSAMVRFILVWRDNCPRTLLIEALSDSDSAVRKRAAVVLNESGLTPKVERILSKSDDAWIRNRVAHGGSALAAGRLADDPDLLVRRTALRRGRLEDDIAVRAATSSDPSVLIALLRNPARLPVRVHDIAVAHSDPGIRVKLAGRRDYGSGVLAKMVCDDDAWIRVNAASHPAATSEQLNVLSADPDERVHRRALRRSADLVEVEPGAIRALGEARSHATDRARQIELASHGDLATRLKLARNRACVDEAQMTLATTPDGEVRRVLGKQGHLCTDAIATLARVEGDYGAQYAVASHRSLPEALRKELVVHPSGAVRIQIAGRPDLDDEDMAILAEDASSQVRYQLAVNKRTPSRHLFTLAQPLDSQTRLDIARHRRADHVVLDCLTLDESSSTRYVVAKRVKKLSPLGKKRLTFDTSFINREVVADDPNADPENLDALADDLAVSISVAKNDRASQQTLSRLLDHPNWECRKAAFTKVKQLSDAQLAAGAADASWPVRRAVAERKDTPGGVLAELVADRSPGIRAAVAEHANASGEALSVLVDDPASRVINGLLRNRNTPTEVLNQLVPTITDQKFWQLAMHPNLDSHGLGQLANRATKSHFLSTIARNERAPADLLTTFARHENETVRIAVASNVAARPEVLRELALDDDDRVRSFVAENLSTPRDVLAHLAEDPNENVRRALAHNPNASAADRVLGALL